MKEISLNKVKPAFTCAAMFFIETDVWRITESTRWLIRQPSAAMAKVGPRGPVSCRFWMFSYLHALMDWLLAWCGNHHLILNMHKRKRRWLWRAKITSNTILIEGEEMEVEEDKYLDTRLDWICNTDAVCKRGQRRLYLLGKLRFATRCCISSISLLQRGRSHL